MIKNRTKYNVDKNTSQRTSDDGIIFDSILEKRFYEEVILPNVQSGIISNYALQKQYILQNGFQRNGHIIRPIVYVADFYVKLFDGRELVLDTKGMPDAVAKIKRKLFWSKYHSVDYFWIAYSKIDGGWLDYEYIQKQRRIRKRYPQQKQQTIDNGKILLGVNFFEKVDSYSN